MRVHRLEIEAFGPFADRVVVDVDALSAEGLFLIHGPTGSGKTSLLDAICFALYADVPGSRSKRGLRSDHRHAAGHAACRRQVLQRRGRPGRQGQQQRRHDQDDSLERHFGAKLSLRPAMRLKTIFPI